MTAGDSVPQTETATDEQPRSEPSAAPLIEIGWILAGQLDKADSAAVDEARHQLTEYLQKLLPEFIWTMPLIRRRELVEAARVEPASLFEYGVAERNLRHWDFTFLVTAADLICYYKSFGSAVFSHSLDVGVISTARVDPYTTDSPVSEEQRVEILARRVRTLALHILGRLNGVEDVEEEGSFRFDIQTVEDLDRVDHFSTQQIEELRESLREIADPRLEEQRDFTNSKGVRFYLKAVWINRGELMEAILEARPWEFPFRLSRLTTAALSAMLILLITAEVWEVAMSQSVRRVVWLSLLAVIGTSTYILLRQRLLISRGQRGVSEQIVVTNVSTCAIVLLGMCATYAVLMFLTVAVGSTLFGESVIQGWVHSVQGGVRPVHYLTLAAFVSSLGIFIGALGASFEEHHYFRHVTYVDEEI